MDEPKSYQRRTPPGSNKMIPLEPYELMQMLHFVKKLKLLIDNCPRESLNEDNVRVSVPLIQTKDAIEQLKSHLDKLVEIGKTEDIRRKEELDYWVAMAMSGDPEQFAWEHSQKPSPGSVDIIC